MDYLAAEYGVCKGTICLSIQWVEDTLVKDGTFVLRGKRVLKRKSTTVKHIVIDVTESPINRPKEGQKEYYSGKKRHTLKRQVIIEQNTKEIIDVQEGKGSEHDFKIYKDTIGSSVSNSIPIDADLVYVGIDTYHKNSFIPIKSSKKHPLKKREKAYNKRFARRRVVIEHVNSQIKIFRRNVKRNGSTGNRERVNTLANDNS